MTTTAHRRIDLQFDARSGDPAFRIGVWRDAMAVSGRVEVPEDVAPGFVGSSVSSVFGDLMAVRVETSRFIFNRDEPFTHTVSRDHVLINAVESGHISGRCAGRDVAALPGSLVISRLKTPMSAEIEGCWTGLLIPKDVLDRSMRWPNALDGRMFGPLTMQASLIRNHIRALMEIEPRSMAETSRVADATLALIVGSLGGVRPVGGSSRKKSDDLSGRIRRFVSANLGNHELDADLICREFGLSATGLKRTFGKGANLAATIRRLRLHGAYREIAAEGAAGAPLREIAARWGITDQSTFRRAFAREFGHSPSAARRRTAEGTVSVGAISKSLSEFERWFAGM